MGGCLAATHAGRMHTSEPFAGERKTPADIGAFVQGRIRRDRPVPTIRETSAGGVAVRIEAGKPMVAVILRKNRSGKREICLPKGHLERGETAMQAAVREIREETGIDSKIIRHLSSVDYWFSGSSARIHKRVHHFLAEYQEGDITAEFDPDQEAEDAIWLNLWEASRTLSYGNERRVARLALSLLYPNGGRD